MKRTAYLGCALLLTGALAGVPTFAQAPQAPTMSDDAAYTDFYNLPQADPKAKAEAGEKFIAIYPKSQYADGVFRQTVSNYAKAGNWAKVLELVGKTEQLFTTMTTENKANMFAQGMNAAQQAGNSAQIVSYGEKVLSASPNDLMTLITLSSTIPSSTPQDKAAVTKAQGYAAKALTLTATLDPKTLGMTDAIWASQKATIEGSLHTTLGSISYNAQDYAKAEEHLVPATKATPKEGTGWYLLGLVYNQQASEISKTYGTAVAETNKLIKEKADQAQIDELKAATGALQDNLRAKRDHAIEALATAVACGGTTMAPAKTTLEKLWTTKNSGDMSGLDGFINTKKQWLASQP